MGTLARPHARHANGNTQPMAPSEHLPVPRWWWRVQTRRSETFTHPYLLEVSLEVGVVVLVVGLIAFLVAVIG